MNKLKLIALYDQDQRVDVEYPGFRREADSHVVRSMDTSEPGEGAIIYSWLDESNADDIIREQVSYFERIGQDFEWKVYDYDQPSDLKERLASHGFTIGEAEAIMVLDLSEAPGILWQPVQHHLQRIVDPERIADVLSVEGGVWDEDLTNLGQFLRGAVSEYPEQMSVYAAYIDGQPVSAAWIFFPIHSQFASLWGGATLQGYRKRGLYTALLSARAQEARARRVKYLTVDATSMSRPILEKFGFVKIADSYPCKWKLKSRK
jgi:GNAT superfamily N-acetyltransferase